MELESRQDRETRQVELVKTNNILRSLKRISKANGGFGNRSWKRAIYHAISMTTISSDGELEKIRQAMGLP